MLAEAAEAGRVADTNISVEEEGEKLINNLQPWEDVCKFDMFHISHVK